MDNQNTYISASGLKKIIDERMHRIKVLRPEIAQKISDAKEMGDLSENFAYHEAKEQQAQNEMRIVDIQEMVANAVVVEEKVGGKIGLGSTFIVDINGAQKTYEIVGENEASPMDGKISNVSPLGSAFMGKSTGDTVSAEVPSGTIIYKIAEVK